MKEVIITRGKGTPLFPMTKPICKAITSVYEKPIISYLLSIPLAESGVWMETGTAGQYA